MLNYHFKRRYILVVLLVTLFSMESVANVRQDVQSYIFLFIFLSIFTVFLICIRFVQFVLRVIPYS